MASDVVVVRPVELETVAVSEVGCVWRGGGRIQSTKCDLQQQCFDSNYKLRLSLSDSIAPCNGCFNSGGGGRGASTAFNEIQPFPAPAESE